MFVLVRYKCRVHGNTLWFYVNFSVWFLNPWISGRIWEPVFVLVRYKCRVQENTLLFYVYFSVWFPDPWISCRLRKPVFVLVRYKPRVQGNTQGQFGWKECHNNCERWGLNKYKCTNSQFSGSCADTDSFVRGGPTLTFFLGGLSSACQLFGWRAHDGPALALWFFRIAKKPYI